MEDDILVLTLTFEFADFESTNTPSLVSKEAGSPPSVGEAGIVFLASDDGAFARVGTVIFSMTIDYGVKVSFGVSLGDVAALTMKVCCCCFCFFLLCCWFTRSWYLVLVSSGS